MLEKEIRKQQSKVRKEINEMQEMMNPMNGSGFGGGKSGLMELEAYAKMKHDEDSRLSNQLNNISMMKINKSSRMWSWIASISALVSSIAAIITLFFKS